VRRLSGPSVQCLFYELADATRVLDLVDLAELVAHVFLPVEVPKSVYFS
jgi:hypothetical protein